MNKNEQPFNIIGGKPQAQLASEYRENDQAGNLKDRITKIIDAAPIVVFMKGNAQAPQCGFSANTVHILNQLGKNFNTFDILSSPEIRQGVKDFSNWPTFPQVYVKGNLVGGNDIVTEMFQSGELQQLLEAEGL